MHQIPVDTIIVYIKTNTIPIITLKSITFPIVFWEGVLLFFLCVFFSAGKIIMALLLLQNYWISQERFVYFLYNPKSEKVGTVWKTQIKKESSDF